MNYASWTDTTVPNSVAFRRAGGRREYNARRKVLAEIRLGLVVEIFAELGFRRGWQTTAARRLDVHRSTISRDFKKLLKISRTSREPSGTRKEVNDVFQDELIRILRVGYYRSKQLQ